MITLINFILSLSVANGQFANIGNGNVMIGVDRFGQLNSPYTAVLGLPAVDPLNIGEIGLRTGDGLFASTEPGCLCEGWGFSTGSVAGWANNNYNPPATGLALQGFTGADGGDSAESCVTDTSGNTFEICHDYHTTADSIWAMECTVTIKNIGGTDFANTYYRRVMDWDIYPTPFSEFVTITGWPAAALIGSNDNGFCSAEPLSNCNELLAGTTDTNFADSGPADHGARFDFDLGPLEAGDELSFNIYYGVAPGETEAFQALNDVQAEVASLGQQEQDPAGGKPHTFFFGFSGVGGEVIPAPCDKYKYINDGVYRDWHAAKAYCEDECGTELASIRTDDDMACALELVGRGPSPWIGLNSLWSYDKGNFKYLDGEGCPIPHNGIWGQCVKSDFWQYTPGVGEPARPRCPHNDEDGSCCVRLIPTPIGLMDNDIKCDNGGAIKAILCNNAPTAV